MMRWSPPSKQCRGRARRTAGLAPRHRFTDDCTAHPAGDGQALVRCFRPCPERRFGGWAAGLAWSTVTVHKPAHAVLNTAVWLGGRCAPLEPPADRARRSAVRPWLSAAP